MSTSFKVCFKCEKRKPLSAFYRHSETADGRLGKCKECTREDVRQHRKDNIDAVREYDRRRGFRGTRGEVYNMTRKRASGKCELCGSTDNLEKHHPNYDNPKEIVVLCRKCHRTTHSIINLNQEEIKDIAHFRSRE